MAQREILLPWDSQPQEVVEVRRDGSMALVSVVLPSLGPIDIATPSRSITKDANCNVTTTSDGVAYTSSDTNSGLQIGGSFVDLVPATSAITFLARVYVAATGVRRVLFSDWSAAGSANSIAFEQQVAGKWGFYSYASTGSALAVGTVSVGWHTIAATQLANGTLLLWVDGAYLGTKTVSGARAFGTSAALLDSGAFNGSIGWGANQASLLTIWEGEATEEIAKAFHDSPWDFVFAPQSIWVPVSAGGGGSTQTLSPSSIASLEAFGTASISVGTVTVAVSSIASSEAFGTHVISNGSLILVPTGISSAEAFGAASLQAGTIIVTPSGIASAEAFGTGAVLVGELVIYPNGISSAELFGIPTLTGGTPSTETSVFYVRGFSSFGFRRNN